MPRADLRWSLVALAAGAPACDASPAAPKPATASQITAAPSAISPSPSPRFLKGQLHTHSNRSADSDTPPEEVAAWYAAHGYDFVVFTDHNRITKIPGPAGMLVIPGVELTQNLRVCDPPPEPRLYCLLHVNGLFVNEPAAGDPGAPIEWDMPSSLARVDLYGRAVDRALSLGGIAQLNHPNFQFAADAEIAVTLARRGLLLVEIANQAVDSENEGDARHPSTEALWDAALARGAHIYGTATDDAHHYSDADRVRARGEIAYVGDRGFVMVRADKTAESIKKAIVAGDFYSSTGVILDRVDMRPTEIAVDVHPGAGAPRIEVIGDGAVVEKVEGASIRFDPRRSHAGTLRVRVTAPNGDRAFTQPIWIKP